LTTFIIFFCDDLYTVAHKKQDIT